MDTEAPHRKRVSGNREHRTQKLWQHERPIVDERFQQPSPTLAISAETRCRFVDPPIEHTCTSTIERMRKRNLGPQPPKTMLPQGVQRDGR